MELLLSSTLEYKARKTAERYDWDTVKSKYQDILEIYLKNVPSLTVEGGKKNEDGAADSVNKPALTKEILSTKLKALRKKFREAVDDGRRSGHGRVVAIFL